MGIIQGLFKQIKTTATEKEWGIAYRKRDEEKSIISSSKGAYAPIKNNSKFWFADPLGIQCSEESTLLFVEAFSREKNKGVIAVIPFSTRGPKKYRIIIEEEFHMSYPFVFMKNNQWYMIPETNHANKVILYKAVDFPNTWEQTRDLLDSVKCVDTNVFSLNGIDYLITYEKDKTNKLVIYSIDDGFRLKMLYEVDDNQHNKRGAGNILIQNGIIVRPSQNCKQIYGENIVFSSIDLDSERPFTEEIIGELGVNDICIKGVRKNRIIGVHTVSQTNNYQFIDYYHVRYNFFKALSGKAIIGYYNYIRKKIKKHFQ